MKKANISVLLVLYFIFAVLGCSAKKAAVKSDMAAEGKKSSTVSGTVLYKSKEHPTGIPLRGAYVYAYKSTDKGQMGPSDFISNPTDDKGQFSFNVAPGEYFIIARKRADGSSVGILDTGDYSSPVGTKINTIGIDQMEISIDVEKIVEPMFFKKTGAEITDFGIKGFILDEKNDPVAGAFAIAYKDKEMKKLPDYASVPTQADGSYKLYLPAAGKYFIGARVNTKKPPVKGEYYGTYDVTADHSVDVKDGEFLSDINITLKPFTGTAQSEFKGFE